MTKLLEGISVLDLTHRLPGPLAGKLLADLGAAVTKVEDLTFGDPFKSSTFSDMDDSFQHWYQTLNQQKKLLTFDYKDQGDQQKIFALSEHADIILMGLPPKLQEQLKLHQLTHPHACVHSVASFTSRESMHDLNVLAKLGYLTRHVQEFAHERFIAPPFFPVAGMTFSHSIVQHALAALLQAKQKQQPIQVTVSLEQATQELFSPLHRPEQSKFLHNGRYPCYNIYRLRDGHIALACLEEKFWQRLCATFSFHFSAQERFHDQDDNVKEALALTFEQLSKREANDLIAGQDMCVSVF